MNSVKQLTLSIFFACTLLFSIGYTFVNAQALNPTPSGTTGQNSTSYGSILDSAIANPLSGNQNTSQASSNPVMDYFSQIKDGGNFISSTIKYLLSATFGQLFALILQISGYLFELSVSISVANFGIWIIPLLDDAWKLMRDVVNIAVIFALLYISLQTIIGKGPELRKIIVSVVIFGLLTNFSLLFTKSLIDVSNVVALNFYSVIKGNTTNSLQADFTSGVAAKIMSTAHMAGFFSDDLIQNGAESSVQQVFKTSESNTIFGVLLACVVMLIASFMFLQMTFLLVGRALFLFFAIIVSPLMFAGPILFKFEGVIKKGWRDFFSELVSGPIFFILLWLVLFASGTLIDGVLNFVNTMQGNASVSGSIQDFILKIAAQIIAFGVLAAGLQATLTLTKKYARVSGDFAIKNGSKALAYGLGRPLGYAGRYAGGNLGRWMQREGSLYQQAQEYLSKNQYSGVRAMGNLLRGTSNIVKDSSYEIQNIGKTKVGSGVSRLFDVMGKVPGVGNATKGLELGTASDKGYEARMEEADKKITESFQTLNKKVEGTGARKYDKFDTTVRYKDEESGEMITVNRDSETADEWEKIVKKANKYVEAENKKNNEAFLESQRFGELNAFDKLNARIVNVVRGGSDTADNRERAIAAIEKEKSKKAKEGKNKKKNEDTLKEYEETELEKQGLEEGIYTKEDIDAGKHKADSETDEDLLKVWAKIADRKEEKLKTLREEHGKLTSDKKLTGEDLKKALNESSAKLEELKQQINFAKKAQKQIPALRKKIEEAKNKEEKKDQPKKEEQGGKK